jgi:hypothetical protein
VTAPFIADFDAIAVYQSGQVQYYILYPAGQTLRDAGAIIRSVEVIKESRT